jgi:hypothetical protein
LVHKSFNRRLFNTNSRKHENLYCLHPLRHAFSSYGTGIDRRCPFQETCQSYEEANDEEANDEEANEEANHEEANHYQASCT